MQPSARHLRSSVATLTRSLKTPLLLVEPGRIRENVGAIRQALPGVKVYYALKCNPDPVFVRTLHSLQVGFETASLEEVRQLLGQRVPPSQILCFHPIKSPEFLRYLHAHAVDTMAVDSREEVEKVATFAPGSKVVARIAVSNVGSTFPLSGKFGVEAAAVPSLFHLARSLGLKPVGLTTHVGSQCACLATWSAAMKTCRGLWDQCHRAGFALRLFSLGGGLPVTYRTPVVGLSEIGRVIAEMLPSGLSRSECHVSVEPGRAIAATAGTLIASVIGLARRAGEMWAYLDAGTYNGLRETFETGDPHFYPLALDHLDRSEVVYNIGGPTCDSQDTPFRGVCLPQLRLGDRLYVLNAGAYSTSAAAGFNGFPLPRTYSIDELTNSIDELMEGTRHVRVAA